MTRDALVFRDHHHGEDDHEHHAHEEGHHGHDHASDHHGHSHDEAGSDGQAAPAYWAHDNVDLVTAGVDVGSSTTHMVFARVHLQRVAQGLSSTFVVVEREVLWRSPILLTPYRQDASIDADSLGSFVSDCHLAAGIERDAVGGGAVILTGEALKRKNARAIAELFAEQAGSFVCASAGHHLEAVLAAHGSGAVAASRRQGDTRLHIDIGGGTAKIAVIDKGILRGTAAVEVGGRLVALGGSDGREVVRLEAPAREMAASAGIPLSLGGHLTEQAERDLARAFTEVLMAAAVGGSLPADYPRSLLLVDDRQAHTVPELVSFSGGVAEYIYGREVSEFGDMGRSLASAILEELHRPEVGLALVQADLGLRATVIGASEFTVQLSGNTISVPDGVFLPVHNLPVIVLEDGVAVGGVDRAAIAESIQHGLRRLELQPGSGPELGTVAVAVRWAGDPSHARLLELGRGLCDGLGHGDGSASSEVVVGQKRPLVVLLDQDIGRSLALVLGEDLGVTGPIVCLDGVTLHEFDYVDVGAMLEHSRVVPVVIKSLLFDADTYGPTSGDPAPEEMLVPGMQDLVDR